MAISINGTSGISGVDGSAGTPALQGTDSNTGISFGTDTVNINTGGTTRATVDSSGRVGIGTSSPSNALTVQSTSRPQLHVSYNGNGGIYLTSANDVARTNWQIASSETTANTLQIYPSDSVGGTTFTTPAVTIDASRRVGIGTTSPVQVLHVKAGTNANLIVDNSGGGGGDLRISAINDAANANRNFQIQGDQLFFVTGGSEKARLDSSGRLLVGTSSAFSVGGASQYAKLQIKGNTVSDFGVLTIATNEANSTLVAGDDIGTIAFSSSDGSEYAYIKALADGTAGSGDYPGRLTFHTTADGASTPTERFRIDKAGELYTGNLYNRTTAAAANVYVDSNTTLYRSTSSIKYKTDVETLQDNYADAILNIRPVWYRSTCQGDCPTHGWWGFIAEEVAEVDPRLVHWKTTEITYDEKGSIVQSSCEAEPEGVAYERFVPHLLNLIKRQKEAIETLETRVAQLEGGAS